MRWLVPLQAGILAAFVLLFIATLWISGLLNRDEEGVIDVLQRAVARDENGQLILKPTADLQAVRAQTPMLWFLIRDANEQSLSEGTVPPEFARLGPALDHINRARLDWGRSHDKPDRPAARMKRVDTAAGPVQIMATTEGRSPKSVWEIGLAFLLVVLPSALVMTVATLIATPMVIRKAIAGLDEAASQARKIDTDKRGTRLPVETVPIEVAPLVNAVNDALGRLDDGYERHKRFLADAAHELRTPIAILTTRLETLPQSLEKRRLTEDVARLATLAEHLLDLQRLEHQLAELSRIDLVAISGQVIADLAPIAIAAGYDISLQHEAEHIWARGHRSSLERAIVNLVQNAIQHGGRRGAIVVSVCRPATIEVTDEGPGIPECQREQVFEPFHRLQPSAHGAGLGLNLVREIVRLHHGEVSIADAPNGGASFRIVLPPAAAAIDVQEARPAAMA